MYKRYDLCVSYADVPIYSASFSSLNNMVKFACGFDSSICDIVASDAVFDRSIPIDDYIMEFKDSCYGI